MNGVPMRENIQDLCMRPIFDGKSFGCSGTVLPAHSSVIGDMIRKRRELDHGFRLLNIKDEGSQKATSFQQRTRLLQSHTSQFMGRVGNVRLESINVSIGCHSLQAWSRRP